jgi:hypothetical protein
MFPKWQLSQFLPDFLGSLERNLLAGDRLLECIGYFDFPRNHRAIDSRFKPFQSFIGGGVQRSAKHHANA